MTRFYSIFFVMMFSFSGFALAATSDVTSDAQILEVLNVANKAEIKAAEEAKSRASDAEVKQFAQQMIKDHTAMMKSIKALEEKLDISPEESQTSEKFKADAKNSMDELKDMEGKKFDKLYIATQVKMHQMLLDTIKNKLSPNAKSAEMKALIGKATPEIKAHLQHATNMQSGKQ